MKKYLFLIITTILVCTIGCQKTPDNSIIIQKDQSAMLSLAGGKNKLDLAKIPTRFSVEFQSSDKRVYAFVNADINILGTKFPVVRVEPADFSQDEVLRLEELFLKDATLYNLDYIYSKSDITAQMLALQENIDLFETLGRGNEYDEKMQALETSYRDAPDTHQSSLSSRQLEEKTEEQGATAYKFTGMDVGESNLPLQRGRYLYVRNNWQPTSIRGAELTYCDNRSGYISDFITLSSECATGKTQLQAEYQNQLQLTPLDAQKQVEELINKLRLPYSVFDILLIKDGKINELGDMPTAPSKYSYEVRCARKLSDTSSVLISVPSQITSDTFVGSWAYEQFYVYIGVDGIYRIDWASPYKQKETLVEDSSLLDFDSITKIISSATSYESMLDNPNGNIDTISIAITNIYLGMQRVIESNSIDSGLLVPVWCLFGDVVYNYDDGTSESMDSQVRASPILVINAIDGTIIDPVRGY